MQNAGKDALLVEDAVEPVQYRVYPDTPLEEVVDLMIRRGTQAVPVVGEQYEVLGIITVGDALREVVRDRGGEESDGPRRTAASSEPVLARDVMTRAVLCVSETQPLVDAARMMVNKKVQQLPVVRDGELVGLVTRNAVLEALRPPTQQLSEEERDRES